MSSLTAIPSTPVQLSESSIGNLFKTPTNGPIRSCSRQRAVKPITETMHVLCQSEVALYVPRSSVLFPTIPMCAGHSLGENTGPYLDRVLTLGRRKRH
jgi:hypothetical protein